MASSNGTTTFHQPAYGPDPTAPNTTFVQADPSTFRAVVQKLTGVSDDPSAAKLPLTLPSRLAGHKPSSSTLTATSAAVEIGPRKPNFKLHERRLAAKKMDLSIGISERPIFNTTSPNPSPSPYGAYVRNRGMGIGIGGMGFMGFGGEMVMASPVSPLEMVARGSPRTPRSPREEEERAIAEKGFYLHPSPLSTPRGSEPPELLPLFPLHSPREEAQGN